MIIAKEGIPMADKEKMVRRTFTLRPIDVKILERIIENRRPYGARVDSEVIRALIQEEFKRMLAEKQEKEQKQ
jgi:hypothetical protein